MNFVNKMNSIKGQLFISNYVSSFGRTYYNKENDALGLGFSFCGIKVTFEGTSLSASFISTKFYDEIDCPYIAIYVDVEYLDVNTLNKTKMIRVTPNMELVSGLTKGKHTVIIRKLSEANGHPLFLKELKTDGEFVENASKKRYSIEFYGDSLTAGLGMLGSSNDPEYKTCDQNVAIGYASLASSMLNADCSLMAISGFPLAISPYTGESKIKCVPDIVGCADFDGDHLPNELPQWDNANNQPDLVVVNLGANDRNYRNTYPNEDKKVKKLYEEKYIEFVNKLQAIYPKAKILMLSFTSYMKQGFDGLVKKAYKKFDNSKVYQLSISLKGKPTYGTQGHPNRKSHERYAKVLAEFIKENIKK